MSESQGPDRLGGAEARVTSEIPPSTSTLTYFGYRKLDFFPHDYKNIYCVGLERWPNS